jgi:D-inositol-3-phosphate glycosyltransferase
MLRRIAIVSEHASPLAVPSNGDGDSQSLHVAHLARQLARRGLAVDVFTRRDHLSRAAISYHRDGYRVIHVTAGPLRPIHKEDLLPFVGRFNDFLLGFCSNGHPYDLAHAHFWLSGLAAVALKQGLGIPFTASFHSLGKSRPHSAPPDGFPRSRSSLEKSVMDHADRILAVGPKEEEDLIAHYGVERSRIRRIPALERLGKLAPKRDDEPAWQKSTDALLGVYAEAIGANARLVHSA